MVQSQLWGEMSEGRDEQTGASRQARDASRQASRGCVTGRERQGKGERDRGFQADKPTGRSLSGGIRTNSFFCDFPNKQSATFAIRK